MSKPKKWGSFLYRKFRHSEVENKMGAMFKIFMSNAKVFCFLMKGHSVIWPFLKKTLGGGKRNDSASWLGCSILAFFSMGLSDF
jgi:hypothetical protein